MNESSREIIRTLRRLLPEEMAVAGRDHHNVELALPEERQATSQMVAKRAGEFLTGRTCARTALRTLGFADEPILRRPNRAPIWPEGAVGSITHTDGYYAAAAGLSRDFIGIGIDVERTGGVTPELRSYVARPDEFERFDHIDDWATILFSVKESVFKCLNPPTGIWLEFHDVEVTELHDARFCVRVLPLEDVGLFTGTFTTAGPFVLSAMTLAVDAPVVALLPSPS